MVAGEEKVSENRTPAAVIPPNEVITPPVKRARGAVRHSDRAGAGRG